MVDSRDLAKIAVQVTGIRMPVNWDRTLGYNGHARFVVSYWDVGSDDAFIGDGINGAIGGAWWVYTNLVEDQAAHQIVTALLACGAGNLKEHWSLGDSVTEAYMGLVLDRFDHALWVAHLDDAMPLLLKQHKENGSSSPVIAAELARQKKEIRSRQALSGLKRCDCTRGWLPTERGYIPCPTCRAVE